MKSIIENATIEIEFSEPADLTTMASDIIMSLQQHNYGTAKVQADALFGRLMDEQEQRETAAENRDGFTLAVDKNPDAFEEPMLHRIEYTTRGAVDTYGKAFLGGQNNALKYALALHQTCKANARKEQRGEI